MAKRKTQTRHGSRSDGELVDVIDLIVSLQRFLDAVDTWTLAGSDEDQQCRRVNPAGGAFALTAHRKLLRDRFWRARQALAQRHSVPAGRGSSASSVRVGYGGADYTLYFALEEVVRAADACSTRAIEEASVSPRGIADDLSFHQGDVIPNATLERLRASERMLLSVRDSATPFDPGAILHPVSQGPRLVAGGSRGIGREPDREAQRSVTARQPSDTNEARGFLITRDRLARHLKVKGAEWYKKMPPKLVPRPVWSAPMGSGQHSRYPVAALYRAFRKASNDKVRKLVYDASLYALLEAPEMVAEFVKRASAEKAVQKRSKAPRPSKSPF